MRLKMERQFEQEMQAPTVVLHQQELYRTGQLPALGQLQVAVEGLKPQPGVAGQSRR